MIIKIGNVELTDQEAQEYYEQGKYIVSYSGIWQLHYSIAQKRVYGHKISNQKGIARRGRFYALDADQINHILGYQFLAEFTVPLKE